MMDPNKDQRKRQSLYHFPLSNPPICQKRVMEIEGYQYQEQNLIGQGYTSKVYLAHPINNEKQKVAIKVIDKRCIKRDKENMQLLKHEMQIHKSLDHENIVKCYDVIQKQHFYYFVLEYCPHGTLDSFIKKYDHISENTATSIMHQITEGYKYLIEQKVLHRDLKPPNILKKGSVWKICDFGFSIQGKKNLIGQINVGTPFYMAPESLERTFYSPKTDFFALGVICYEIINGNTPWQNKNQKILVEQMRTQRLTKQNINIKSQVLTNFILKCCEPIQRKRMSIEEFKNFHFILQETNKTLQAHSTFLDIASRTTAKSYTPQTLNSSSQNSIMSSCKPSKESLRSAAWQKNSSILERELAQCEILIHLMVYNHYLLLQDQEEKELLFMVLHRHISYMLRRLRNIKFNYLNLKYWDDYIKTESHSNYLNKAEKLSKLSQAYFQKQIKKKSIINIRTVNKRYDDFNYDKRISQKCIENLKEYVKELLTKTYKKYDDLNKIYEEDPEGIKTLHQLLLYYQSLIVNDSSSSQVSQSKQQNLQTSDCPSTLEKIKLIITQ